jgi:hypothetical protein
MTVSIYCNWYELWSVLSSILSKSKTWEKCPGENWLSRLAVYMYRPSGVHIQQIAGGQLRLSGMTFLFCNRHLWVYDSTETQGRATVSKKTGTNFLWFSNPPPLMCSPVQYQASLAATEHLTPQDFIQDYLLQELKRVFKCISITYQYISVMWFTELLIFFR